MLLLENIAITSKISNPDLYITFNGEEITETYTDYIQKCGFDTSLTDSNDIWDICVSPVVYNKKDTFGIVNGAECSKGKHFKYLYTKVTDMLIDILDKQKINIPRQTLGSFFNMFININLCDPDFDSQSKDELTTEDFGDPILSKSFYNKLKKSCIINSIKEYKDSSLSKEEMNIIRKQNTELKKKSVKSINKFIDCNAKGKRKDTELWLFEGDSAGSNFRATRDPKKHGAYLLRGKFNNTIKTKTIDLIKKEEVNNIVCSYGLKYGDPDNLKDLRFDKLVLATDMDVDGYCIAGQIIAFLATHFSGVLKAGKVYRALSPIMKAIKGKDIKYYYTLDEFRKDKNTKGYKIKYYKGLGSLTKEDYSEMINNPRLECIEYIDQDFDVIKDWFSDEQEHKDKRKKMISEI